jgi:hypothetical protein
MHWAMTERAFEVVGLVETKPFLDPGITFTLLVIAFELIGWHLDRPHMFCMFQ